MTTLNKSVSQSYTGTAVGTHDVLIVGKGTWQISGTFVGTLRLLRSNADEDNFVPANGLDGNNISMATPGTLVIDEPDSDGAKYKAECTAYTSGTAVSRIKDGAENV